MFSFHKPKIYRSNLGCCICKAKSSSSRFTDSKKYENEFEQCFRLKEKRSGEICNACVLLVKRWKKLTPENRLTKHWHHVVDARAGPGTKLTGNRRLTSPSSSQQRSSSNSTNNESNNSDQSNRHRVKARNSDVLPLGSSQANIQSGSSSKGSHSLGRVCAIDTNVSTFTFGEPIVNVNRTRSYMTNESSYQASTFSASTTLSSSSISLKPQSALNSSAFESVIKRFRQRQQQQQLEAKRRQLSRQQKSQQRPSSKTTMKTLENPDNDQILPSSSDQPTEIAQKSTSDLELKGPVKRAQRYSSIENAFGICSVLDSSIWRREKICCGVIFRGLYNEIAVVPRLLKPCQCRLNRKSGQTKDELAAVNSAESDNLLINEEDEDGEQVPPTRVTKSYSISSCDSNTSGCGSMEDALNSGASLEQLAKGAASRRVDSDQVESLRKRSRLESNKQLSVGSPSGSSSGNSSSQLARGDDDNEDDEELGAGEDIMMEHGIVLGTDDASTSDSSNDATNSSIESLSATEIGGGEEANTIAY